MTKQNLTILIIGIISVFALVFSLIRVMPFEVSADTYVGIIVTLLSVAVTVAIGYQIFNIIEFKQKLESHADENAAVRKEILNTKDEVKKLQVELQKRISRNNNLSEMRDALNEADYLFRCDPEKYCIESISTLMTALYYALESDYEHFDCIFHDFRKYITNITSHTLQAVGGCQTTDGVWHVIRNNKEWTLDEWIDDVMCATLFSRENMIKNHSNYPEIKYEYIRVTKILRDRIDAIKKNPLIIFYPEDNQPIMAESPLYI